MHGRFQSVHLCLRRTSERTLPIHIDFSKEGKNLVTIVVDTFDSSSDASSLDIACVVYMLVCLVKRFLIYYHS